MLVVIAFHPGDAERALNLAIWTKELGGAKGHDLLLIRDAACKPEIAELIHSEFAASFDNVEVLALTDHFRKWPEAPNSVFATAARHILNTRPQPWLFCEPDCVPLKTGWLDLLEKEYAEAGKPFLGDFVSIHTPELDVPDHCSGNAVYPGNMLQYAGLALIAGDIAFDVAAASQIVPQMHKSKYIHHSWKHPGFKDYAQFEREVLAFKPDCALFHASKDGSLLRLLRERLSAPSIIDKSEYGKCGVEDCEKPLFARGTCKMHYARLDRNGHFGLQIKPDTSEKLFRDRKITPNGCWLWTGSVGSNGYGQVYLEGVAGPQAVHRISFQHFIGEIPDGMSVCHKCDVKTCFNPDHLFLGTDTDNMRDAAEKGRIPRGETHPFAKLTDQQVSAIRSRYAVGGISQLEIAKEFGCSQSNVSMIVVGMSRKTTRAFVTDILIKSYPPDYPYLNYCVRSLQKFARGFRQIVLIVPEAREGSRESIGLFVHGILKDYTPTEPDPIKIRVVELKESGDGYLFQQTVKASAHEYTDADFVVHLDSDCFLLEPIAPEMFFRDGAPIWYKTPYASIDAPWKAPTEKFLGEPVEFEFMRRMPIVAPRALHKAAAAFCLAKHGVRLTDYILSQPNREFSEFNALGALAYARARDDFHWIDTTKEELPRQVLVQRWSHDGLTEDIKAEYETILKRGDALCRSEQEHTAHAGTEPETQVSIIPAARNMIQVSEHSAVPTFEPERAANPAIKQTKEGWWVLVNDSHISRWIEEHGTLFHDKQTLPLVLPEIPIGGTVIDVGAFVGDTAIPFADRVGPHGMVFAFEPNPDAYKCLSRNVDIRGVCNITTGNNALSDSVARLKFVRDKNAGASYIDNSPDAAGVLTMRLDALNLDRCDFIKIDTDGFELRVLRGAGQTINRFHPKLLIEVNRGALERQGADQLKLYAWLQDHGYDYRIVQPECSESDQQYDILCNYVGIIRANATGESVSTTNRFVTESVSTTTSPALIEPWQSPLQTIEHVRSLAEQLKIFCAGSVRTRQVRQELHFAGVIELPYRMKKRKGWRKKRDKRPVISCDTGYQ